MTTGDDEFIERLLKAMLEPIDTDIEPCCPLFGHTLHHHWGV